MPLGHSCEKAHKGWDRNIQTEICAFVGITICEKDNKCII